jgi:putative flippase GtrA
MDPSTLPATARDLSFPPTTDRLRPLLFCLVGGAAACAHFVVAVLGVALLRWPPILASCAGYVIGLATSYGGQSRITFRRERENREPLGRFVLSSLIGFAVNSAVFGAMLRWTSLDYRIALATALVIAAAVTFVIMDRWVFATAEAGRDG